MSDAFVGTAFCAQSEAHCSRRILPVWYCQTDDELRSSEGLGAAAAEHRLAARRAFNLAYCVTNRAHQTRRFLIARKAVCQQTGGI